MKQKKSPWGCVAVLGIMVGLTVLSRVLPHGASSPNLGWIPLTAETPPEGSTSVVLILDTSGSMDQRVATGESKLQIAQEVLTGDFIPVLSDDVYLAAYRFEKKSADAEVLAPLRKSSTVDKPGWLHREVVMEVLDHVRAAGGTPIAASLRAARGALEKVAGRKICVLVTDGEESYESRESVVAETRQLRDRGVETYVVGFNLGGQGQYLANELGVGKNYFIANGGREALLEAMKSIEAAIEK